MFSTRHDYIYRFAEEWPEWLIPDEAAATTTVAPTAVTLTCKSQGAKASEFEVLHGCIIRS